MMPAFNQFRHPRTLFVQTALCKHGWVGAVSFDAQCCLGPRDAQCKDVGDHDSFRDHKIMFYIIYYTILFYTILYSPQSLASSAWSIGCHVPSPEELLPDSLIRTNEAAENQKKP